MATPTVVSNARTTHRAAKVSADAHQGTLALDWANGQSILLTGSSQQSTVFDAANDRVVFCSVGGASTVGGCWISVGTNPSASPAAGSQWISQTAEPVPVYVPAGMVIAGRQGQTAGFLSMIPALIAGNGGSV